MSLLTKIEKPLKSNVSVTVDFLNRCDSCGNEAVGDETGIFKGKCPKCAEVAFRLERRAEINGCFIGCVVFLVCLVAVYVTMLANPDTDKLIKMGVIGGSVGLMHEFLRRGLKAIYDSIKEKRAKMIYFFLILIYFFCVYFDVVFLPYITLIPLAIAAVMIVLVFIRIHQKDEALAEYKRLNAQYVLNRIKEEEKDKNKKAKTAIDLGGDSGSDKGLMLDLETLGRQEISYGNNQKSEEAD